HSRDVGRLTLLHELRAQDTRTGRPGRLSRRLRRALFEPPRAARQAFAVVVLADHLAALAVEDHHRRDAAPALPTGPTARVWRGGGGGECAIKGTAGAVSRLGPTRAWFCTTRARVGTGGVPEGDGGGGS